MVISPPLESTKYSSWATDMAGVSHFAHDKTIVVKAKKTIACIFIIIVLIKGEFNLEVQHTSKVKNKQLFTASCNRKTHGDNTLFPPVYGLEWSGGNLRDTLSSDTDRRRKTGQ
jgi:hypothetical protein